MADSPALPVETILTLQLTPEELYYIVSCMQAVEGTMNSFGTMPTSDMLQIIKALVEIGARPGVDVLIEKLARLAENLTADTPTEQTHG
jgi:hypothetical protein